MARKKRRGRPKGSKNKKRKGALMAFTHHPLAGKRKRGRPKGSKNKGARKLSGTYRITPV